MKSLTQHVAERLQLTRDRVRRYEYFPKTKDELDKIINDITNKHNNECYKEKSIKIRY